MAFMKLQTQFGKWYLIEVRGSTSIVPYDAIGPLPLPNGFHFKEGDTVTDLDLDNFFKDDLDPIVGLVSSEFFWKLIAEAVQDYIEEGCGPLSKPDDLDSIELKECWGARYSAPGYLDCTSWTLGETEEEAIADCKEMYGEDEEDKPKCSECGKEFHPDDASDSEFCSDECRDLWDESHMEPEEEDLETYCSTPAPCDCPDCQNSPEIGGEG